MLAVRVCRVGVVSATLMVGTAVSVPAGAVGSALQNPAPAGCGAATALASVAMANAGAGWAVGTAASGSGYVAVLRGFDHGTWSPVDIPLPTGSTSLFGVGAASATAAVTVGENNLGTLTAPRLRPMALMWDGTAWRQMPMSGAPAHGALYSVAVLAPNDVWAAGVLGGGLARQRPLVMHWDGTTWSPRVFSTNSVPGWVNGISAASDTDVWAVATVGIQNLAVHWDGTSWTRHGRPSGWGSVLNGVTTFPNGKAMAVGWSGIGTPPDNQALVLDWDGSGWTRGDPQQPSPKMDVFNGVSAAGRDDIWAVGVNKTPDGQQVPMAQHWDGTQWTLVPVPAPGGASQLLAVATVSDHDAWAVGVRGLRTLNGCLLDHWDGTSWTTTG